MEVSGCVGRGSLGCARDLGGAGSRESVRVTLAETPSSGGNSSSYPSHASHFCSSQKEPYSSMKGGPKLSGRTGDAARLVECLPRI